MTKTILTGPGVRDWDPPETKALYWSGACYALGLRSLAKARQAWIDKNQALGDDYARKEGLLK